MGTFWALWGVLAPTLGTKSPHRGTTETVETHCEALEPKMVSPGLPKWVSAAEAETLVATREYYDVAPRALFSCGESHIVAKRCLGRP